MLSYGLYINSRFLYLPNKRVHCIAFCVYFLINSSFQISFSKCFYTQYMCFDILASFFSCNNLWKLLLAKLLLPM